MENKILSIEEINKLNCREIAERYIQKHNPVFYAFLNEKYGYDISYDEKIYLYRNNLEKLNIGHCKLCGKPTKFVNKTIGYAIYCSAKCSNSDKEKIEKQKQTTLLHYGVENPSQHKTIKEKKKQTCASHFEGGYASEEIKKKVKQTKLERYGDEHYTNIEQQRKTKKERYNDATFTNREKSAQTTLKKYGYKSPFGCREFIEKSAQTKLERYGDPYYTNIEKGKQTCLEKYGVENPFAVNEIREKIKQTLLERYGVTNAFSINKQQKIEKTKQTTLERYGVPYFVLTDKCTGAFNNNSKPNKEFAQLLDENNIQYTKEFALETRSYDFKIGNVLVEINPFPTHNVTWGPFENPKSKNYHLLKTMIAKRNGYRCIHVWDWDDKNKIIELLKYKETVYARKCELKEPTKQETDLFLNENHLQGTCKGQTIRIGLYYNNELIQIMTFGKPRYNKKYEYELLRLCTKNGYKVVGGAERCFKHFIDDKNPDTIISYCDFSKFNGDIYTILGFKQIKQIAPSKHWYNGKTKMHITDNLLRQRGYDQLFKTNYGKGTSNEELMLQNKFVEIYDAGQLTFLWNKSI